MKYTINLFQKLFVIFTAHESSMNNILSNDIKNVNTLLKEMAINIYIPWNIWQKATALNNFLWFPDHLF